MRITFLAYRDWALEVAKSFVQSPTYSAHTFSIIESPSELKSHTDKQDTCGEIFIAIGWSWIIDGALTRKHLILGIHPSDLPHFRGGSPLQHQILSGLTSTKCTLFQITENLDSGGIFCKVDLDLQGDSMGDVLSKLKDSARSLIAKYLDNYSSIRPLEQNIGEGSHFKRRMPHESRLTFDDFDLRDLTGLYNKIRCLTDPYPNAYIEDSVGNRLFFEKIRFVKAKPDQE